ncbi:YybH family protein [Aestuariivivens sediminis]|uniref:YybH family protein n=1 Tax=Aestuariivivens sediminis TaxID=2913557 RepID=UPI001F5648D9|nr:nuclear transport factor 2 family protein [Aestuariivivens sediminis]
MTYFSSHQIAIFSVLLILLITQKVSSQSSDKKWELQVKNEINSVLEKYRNAMLSHDYKDMISFWSNSDDFVMGSDGRIIGGYQDWVVETTHHYENTLKFEQWDWENIHILPLSKSLASVTLEFEFKSIDLKNNIYHAIGSWTYVFKKDDDSWKVIHSNGHHIKL